MSETREELIERLYGYSTPECADIIIELQQKLTQITRAVAEHNEQCAKQTLARIYCIDLEDQK